MLPKECKIIAIKPLEKCSPEFLKVLTADFCYTFYNEYKIIFSKISDKEDSITFIQSVVKDLYSFDGNLINISAIVGKNGSGKSSLIELFYVGLFNLSRYVGMIKRTDTGIGYGFVEEIHFDLYYKIGDDHFKLRFSNKEFLHYAFNSNLKGFSKVEKITKKTFFESFPYSLGVNYSQYGLNTFETGRWLSAIFNKNDVYQTPLVLNPFREDGNININSENYLVRSRILSIILEEQNEKTPESNSFFGERKPTVLQIEIDESKFRKNRDGKITFAEYNSYGKRIMPTLYAVFLNNPDFVVEENYFNRLAIDYILRKLKSIIGKYPHYRKFSGFATKNRTERLTKFLSALKTDPSHVTFKLKQAINYLANNYLPKNESAFKISVSELSEKIYLSSNEKPEFSLIEHVPPSFLKVEIQFNNPNDTLSKFSSGEKQRLFSTASVFYHLRNLDSLHGRKASMEKDDVVIINYSYVNLVFDEIELYFHPDFQRRYVSNILATIKRAGLKYIRSFNITFITHSPFILSDIPEQNIMYLEVVNEKAIQHRYPNDPTFGGNIHELLAKSFFLEKEGYMGEFAKKKIQSAIDFLESAASSPDKYPENGEWNQSSLRLFIDSIGEELIRDGLEELYVIAYSSVTDIQKEIDRLTKLKKLKQKSK